MDQTTTDGLRALWRLERLRARSWGAEVARAPSILLGALVAGWAAYSAFGELADRLAAAPGWLWLSLTALFLLCQTGLHRAQGGYVARLLEGPLFPLLADGSALSLWWWGRSVVCASPVMLLGMAASMARGWRPALLAGAAAFAATALNAALAVQPSREQRRAGERVRRAVPKGQRRAAPGMPALILLRAGLRRRIFGLRSGGVTISVLAAGLAASLLANVNAPESAAGAVLFALTGAGALLLAAPPNLQVVALLRHQPIGLARLLGWFLAVPLSIGAAWMVAADALPLHGRARLAPVLGAGGLLVAAWFSVLLLHGMVRPPPLARFGARAELILLLILVGLFPPAMPLLVPGWIMLRLGMLARAARHGRWAA